MDYRNLIGMISHKQIWQVSSVSVRGADHIKHDIPCQDYCKVYSYKGAQILSLSDGAGSCKQSHLGSRAACIGFIRGIKKIINEVVNCGICLEKFIAESDKEDWISAIICARESLEKIALEKSYSATKDMSCTLLGAVIYSDAAVVIQIGDGAWVAELNNSEFHCVTWPENGEYNNETYFLTELDWMDHIQINIIHPKDKILSLTGFSDGVERLCINFDQKKPVSGFFGNINNLRKSASRKNFENGLAQFLSSSRVTALTNDDCSIVSACRESF
jgi:hypothetical protein